MRRSFVIIAALVLAAVGAVAQEGRSEISLQGTGFFTKDSNFSAGFFPSGASHLAVPLLQDTDSL